MPSLIALLGHTPKPTCGVKDYCTFLRRALGQLGVRVEVAEVNWAETSWRSALLQLWRKSSGWRGSWVVLQYTAGAWSRYGFPFGALLVVTMLRYRGMRCAVMFHEPYSWEVPPTDLLDRLRSVSQNWVIRILYRSAAKAIFADPVETISWLRDGERKAVFIPIGGNIPEPPPWSAHRKNSEDSNTVAVFCLSDPPRRKRELDEIAHAIRVALPYVPKIRLVLLGRGTADAKNEIEQVFAGMPIEVQNLGLRSAEDVSRTLSEADAMLCVRGRLFARRGSALAGIACGVPIIAYSGPAQQTPLSQTGIEFVPYGDRDALGATLTRVLTDRTLQTELRARNRWGQQTFFSWKAIASRHLETLGLTGVGAASAS